MARDEGSGAVASRMTRSTLAFECFQECGGSCLDRIVLLQTSLCPVEGTRESRQVDDRIGQPGSVAIWENPESLPLAEIRVAAHGVADDHGTPGLHGLIRHQAPGLPLTIPDPSLDTNLQVNDCRIGR